MNDNRRVGWALLGIVGVLLVALLAVELPTRAEPPTPMPPAASETGGGMLPVTGQLKPPDPPPTPVDDGGDGGDGEGDGGDTGTVKVVERHTIWRILFPYETLGASIRAALMDTVAEMGREVAAQAREAVNHLGSSVLQQEGMFQDVRRDVWKVSIVVAGILMPLSFLVSVVAALKEGTSSVTGYASAREALLNWVIAAGAAVSSYFLLTKAIELATAGMGAIFEGLLGGISGSFDLGDHIIGTLIDAGTYVATPGLGQLFVLLFGMLLAVAVVLSIGLALLAREVILILAVGIAPIALILGGVGPLRWLSGLWMKITTTALLLGPANALLLGAGALLGIRAHQSGLSGGGLVDRILGYLVVLGIVSVLIGMNTLVGKMVYGAVIEIAEKAAHGVMAVVNLAGIAVGAAVAPAVGGMLGGTAAATAGSAGAGLSAAGGIGAIGEASSQMRAVSSIGQVVAATGLPGARGFSAGMNMGGALNAHSQVKQGIAQGAEARANGAAGEPWEKGELSMGRAIDTAHGDLKGELTAGGPKGILGASGISPEDASHRLEVGRQLNQNLMAVGEKHGVDMRVGLRQLGIGGTDAQAAGVAYARASMRETSFGVPSPFRNPVPARSLPNGMTARDLDTARQIVGAVRPHELRSAPSVEFLDNLVQTAFHRRTQLSEDPRRTVEDGTQATDLDRWMKVTYNNLPDRGRAGGLRRGLGL